MYFCIFHHFNYIDIQLSIVWNGMIDLFVYIIIIYINIHRKCYYTTADVIVNADACLLVRLPSILKI